MYLERAHPVFLTILVVFVIRYGGSSASVSIQASAASDPWPSNNGGGGGGGGGSIGGLLEGVELNLLDAKLIGLGYVREDLVRQLCHQATQQLIWEGVQR